MSDGKGELNFRDEELKDREGNNVDPP